ncbi:MAG: hypothetical protein ACI8RZ_000124 [Myxococcota bacterium]|jgi:hypothetical protein
MEDDAVAAGVALIQAREWYEAHEVLEVPWRAAAGETKLALQALIQAAVSLEHLRRGNPRGAWGQWNKARAKMDAVPPVMCGVAVASWRNALADFYVGIDIDERSRRAVARESMDGLPPLPPVENWPLPQGAPIE